MKPTFAGGPPKPPKQSAPGGGGEPHGEPSRVIKIPDPVILEDLAKAVAQKPHKIIADLMELGIFTTLRGSVGFRWAAKIASRYGYKAHKVS